MTRRRIGLRHRFFATSASAFLTTPDGARLLDLLTAWWIEGEGLHDGAEVDHRGRAAADRYDRLQCYRMLDEAGYPALPDRDEPALDAVHKAFLSWAVSRKARGLARRLADQAAARGQVEQAVRRSEDDRTTGIVVVAEGTDDSVHRHAHDSVQQHVHDSVQQSIHQQVHHAVHQQVQHAVHQAATHSAAGGGHGGHH